SVNNSVSIGVVLGLLLGKFAGILGFTWITVKLGLAGLPQHTNWRHIAGVSVLAGIGFTMSLFISELAFDDSLLIGQAKYGILIASVLAAITGSLILRKSSSEQA